jgi:tetratricopeptide (TPR) repeat protein
LPLALELAAARLKALSATQILARLEQRLPFLTGGPRDAPDRQRTLRATIDWSHELLALADKRLLHRLAVFAGGCSFEAAERVAGADLDALQSLVEKSLLRFNAERYATLETIREYAAERLEQSGDADEVRRRHAEFYLELAVSAGLSSDAESARRHDLVLPEQDNLRAAIDWCVAAGHIELGLRLAVALENFWVTIDPFEGIRRFETLVALSGDVAPVLRARALRCYGGSSTMAGLHDQAQHAFEESLEIFRRAGAERDVAVLLHRLGTNTLNLGHPEQARDLLEESLAVSRRIGSKRVEAQTIGSLGHLARTEGDFPRAIALFEESLATVDRGFVWWRVGMSLAVAECQLEMGRTGAAEAPAMEALSAAREIADRQSVVFALACLACVCADRGDIMRAARLWGAIESEEARGPVGQWEGEREKYASRLRRVSGKEFDDGVEEGRQLSLGDAADEALAAGEGGGRHASSHN